MKNLFRVSVTVLALSFGTMSAFASGTPEYNWDNFPKASKAKQHVDDGRINARRKNNKSINGMIRNDNDRPDWIKNLHDSSGGHDSN